MSREALAAGLVLESVWQLHRRLIERHGYGRRLEELADAETATKDWK